MQVVERIQAKNLTWGFRAQIQRVGCQSLKEEIVVRQPPSPIKWKKEREKCSCHIITFQSFHGMKFSIL